MKSQNIRDSYENTQGSHEIIKNGGMGEGLASMAKLCPRGTVLDKTGPQGHDRAKPCARGMVEAVLVPRGATGRKSAPRAQFWTRGARGEYNTIRHGGRQVRPPGTGFGHVSRVVLCFVPFLVGTTPHPTSPTHLGIF